MLFLCNYNDTEREWYTFETLEPNLCFRSSQTHFNQYLWLQVCESASGSHHCWYPANQESLCLAQQRLVAYVLCLKRCHWAVIMMEKGPQQSVHCSATRQWLLLRDKWSHTEEMSVTGAQLVDQHDCVMWLNGLARLSEELDGWMQIVQFGTFIKAGKSKSVLRHKAKRAKCARAAHANQTARYAVIIILSVQSRSGFTCSGLLCSAISMRTTELDWWPICALPATSGQSGKTRIVTLVLPRNSNSIFKKWCK